MEGFGLPVAEGMAAGCPVVASDLACVREFALDAPLYSPPGDAPALAASLARVLGDPDLRGGMAERGVRASEDLRWERTAELSARAIESALGR
jgi:alpha-1,3-rhamnosyl/mannosyltransferase